MKISPGLNKMSIVTQCGKQNDSSDVKPHNIETQRGENE